jgi:rRNA-processing protein FCF1
VKLHINDANILIDIVQLNLVDAFLSLGFELYTTDFVFAELETTQQQVLQSDKLKIITTDVDNLQAIFNLSEQHNGLSFEDCSVWYYAQQMNGILITGDGRLRTKAKASGIDVKGIIYIIEEIKMQNILDRQTCIEKMTALKALNNRLPQTEIIKRIDLWQLEIKL